jgi:hypothetical protein
MRILLAIGITLLVLSACPIYLIAVELTTSRAAYHRFEVSQQFDKEFDYRSTDFYGHHVVLSEARDLGLAKSTDRSMIAVRITIDGKDYSLDSPVEIDYGARSYNGWLAIVILKDRQSGTEQLAVVQRVMGDRYPEDTRYRILFVQPDGKVSEEWFTYGERANPLYRTVLAAFVHPEQLGFHSQVMSSWPTIYFPIIYPFVTAVLGTLLTFIASVLLVRKRRRKI